MSLYPEIDLLVETLRRESDAISDERRLSLDRLTGYMRDRSSQGHPVSLNFICTHNSRRSQMAQIWGTVAARVFSLENVSCYSGGTEVTACNHRTVAALERAGFVIGRGGGSNPRLQVRYGPDTPPVVLFSKTFDDPVNPGSDFAAVMTCSHADETCPFIPGATRISLPFDDPGEADGTSEESARYDERLIEIGREILYSFAAV